MSSQSLASKFSFSSGDAGEVEEVEDGNPVRREVGGRKRRVKNENRLQVKKKKKKHLKCNASGGGCRREIETVQ